MINDSSLMIYGIEGLVSSFLLLAIKAYASKLNAIQKTISKTLTLNEIKELIESQINEKFILIEYQLKEIHEKINQITSITIKKSE